MGARVKPHSLHRRLCVPDAVQRRAHARQAFSLISSARRGAPLIGTFEARPFPAPALCRSVLQRTMSSTSRAHGTGIAQCAARAARQDTPFLSAHEVNANDCGIRRVHVVRSPADRQSVPRKRAILRTRSGPAAGHSRTDQNAVAVIDRAIDHQLDGQHSLRSLPFDRPQPLGSDQPDRPWRRRSRPGLRGPRPAPRAPASRAGIDRPNHRARCGPTNMLTKRVAGRS